MGRRESAVSLALDAHASRMTRARCMGHPRYWRCGGPRWRERPTLATVKLSRRWGTRTLRGRSRASRRGRERWRSEGAVGSRLPPGAAGFASALGAALLLLLLLALHV